MSEPGRTSERESRAPAASDGRGWIMLVRWGVVAFGLLVAAGVGLIGDRPDWRKSLLVLGFVAAYLGLWTVAMSRRRGAE